MKKIKSQIKHLMDCTATEIILLKKLSKEYGDFLRAIQLYIIEIELEEIDAVKKGRRQYTARTYIEKTRNIIKENRYYAI